MLIATHCETKEDIVPMKKLLSLALTLMLLTSAASALANTVIDPNENRGIQLTPAGLNEVEEGVSPTTGRVLADVDTPAGFAGQAVTGRYMPMLVQIDNTTGGVTRVAPWGASYADIMYETPLYRNGVTRMSYLFSDQIPDSVGPVRSARMGHAWLREEWDAGFLFYGQQEHEDADVKTELSRLGVNKKGLAFSGTVGENKPWKQYYSRRHGDGLAAPSNADANVAGMYSLIDESYVAPNHAFRFTDEAPQGESVQEIRIKTGAMDYGSNLIYDVDSNLYFRYMRHAGDELVPYEDRDTGEQIAFSNVIIQFTDVLWVEGDAPVAFQVGRYYYDGRGDKTAGGNADIFMGGVHVKGYWQRDDMASRTVFYGEDGQEIELQRGKTLIVIADKKNWEVSYQ